MLDAREPRERVTIVGWQSSFVAALEAGKLLVATPELAEQFDAQRAQAVRAGAKVRAGVPAGVEESVPIHAVREATTRNVTPAMRENLARMKSLVGGFTGRGLPGIVA